MKRIIYILLLATGLVTVAPVVSLWDSNVTAAYAADNKAKTKAQKEKEKAKLLKQKEREKAAAKAQKEKAAAQKQKEQANAKAQKEREKAKAAQAKAASKQAPKPVAKSSSKPAAKPVAKSAAKPKAEPFMTAEQEKARYMEQVAAIDKANAGANAYNNRDINHRIGLWGLVGYSNLFTSGVMYEPAKANANSFGFMNTDKGYVGGGGGLGYQLRYKQFLMTTGVEFTLYNSVMALSGAEDGNIYRSYGMMPYADVMTYHYMFQNMQEQIIGGFVQVPLLFGMELKQIPLYWQAGVKAGLGVMKTSQLTGQLTTTIEDKELINSLTNMYTHSLVNGQEVEHAGLAVPLKLNVAASAEIGLNLDKWVNAATKLRVALFADYGLVDALDHTLSPEAQDLPMQMLVAKDPLNYPVNSALATTAMTPAAVHPFLVGAKVAMWFNLPRKPRQTQDYPKMPQPRMGVYLYDVASAQALGGAAVEITHTATGKTIQKNTNRQGMLEGRFASGQYRISAAKNGYYPSDTVLQTVEDFTFDTLRLALERIPAPVVYTLCMNIYDAETHMPIEATARLTTATDTVVLYEAQSSDDGFIETPLTEGTYIAHASAVGYMSKDETLRFVRDTLDIFLQPIKKGIKVKIENLFFATNKTYILPQSEQAMSDLANFLLENPGVTIHITGHTDAVGSDEANQILSEGRANAVKADLATRGVAPERITTEGKGEKEPVADNDTEEGRQLNRRVEFVITGTDGEDIQQVF